MTTSRDNSLLIKVGVGVGVLSLFAFLAMFHALRELKQESKDAVENVKKEVLMPGGTNTYPSQMNSELQQKMQQQVAGGAQAAPAAAPAPAPAPAPNYAPPPPPPAPPVRGPGNFDYPTPSYNRGPVGPGNYE